ncbi:MAG: DUF4271 domain-containing protein [Leadbetterella sp.]
MIRSVVVFCFLLLYFSGFSKTVGPKDEYQTIKDFNFDWEIYSSSKKMFLPFVEQKDGVQKAFVLRFNLNDFPNTDLVLNNKGNEVHLFINKQLFKTLKKGKWLIISTSFLKKTYGSEYIEMFFYGDSHPKFIDASLGYKTNLVFQEKTSQIVSSINYLNRSGSPLRSALSFGFLMLVGLVSFLASSFSKAFVRYVNIRGMFSKLGQESMFLVNKPLDRPNVLFVILTSVMISFFLALFSPSNGLKIYTSLGVFETWDSTLEFLLNYILVLLISLTLLVSKYFLIRIFGGLFFMDKVIDIYYFRLIQSTLIFVTILVLVLLINHSVQLIDLASFGLNFIQYGLILFFGFRFLVVFNTLNSIENTNTLYLICYLCIVEFLPIVLGFKLFV